MENTAQSGMIKFEQLCEELLEKQDIPENIKTWFQINILDTAQNIFENQIQNKIGVITMAKRESMMLVIVDEVLHSGLSIDTEQDQDYVCKVIRERIEEELF